MIDYCSIELPPQVNKSYITKLGFDLKDKPRNKNSIIWRGVADWENLKIVEHSNSYYLEGSIHKFSKTHGLNHDLFTLKEIESVIGVISYRLQIDPADCIIHSMEAGVNLKLPYDLGLILNDLIHCRYTEIKNQRLKNSGNLRSTNSQHIIVKYYDKSKHVVVDDNILRYEVKFRRMQRLQRIYGSPLTLVDLINPRLIFHLREILKRKWNETYLLEHDCLSKLPVPIKMEVLESQNINYWKVKNSDRPYERLSKKVGYFISVFRSFGQDRHTMIKNLIEQELKKVT